ncbi:intermembrane phospholipid transport protein YdbH family protein [Microbulbifer sp. SSSA002]|uniref:intermembrane phospholipid transport protein YdbH family protein n=1 Tax=Microbulbifer sp. SSSA002 TaxID=3243376 RepID=UPI004039DEEA
MSLACLLAVLIAASWWKKDIVISQLVNLFSGEVVIQELTGLRLGFKQVSIEEVRLKSTVNSNLLLEGVTIVYPFHIIYDRDNTQKVELSIQKLTRSMDVAETSNESSADKQRRVNNATKNVGLSLNALNQNLTRFLPGKVSVREVVFDGLLTAGPLSIVRNNVNIYAQSPFQHPQLGELNLDFQADLTPSVIKLNPRILSSASRVLSEANITLNKKSTDTWAINSKVVSDLETLAPFIDIINAQNNSKSKLTAFGQVLATATMAVPDNLLSTPNYRDISIQVSGRELKASTSYPPLKSEIEARLSTDKPIEIYAKTLFPFKAQSIKGNGQLEIFLRENGANSSPLIDIKFDSSTPGASPELAIEGILYLNTANTVLHSPEFLRHFPALPLNITKGKVAFQGHLQSSSLSSISTPRLNRFRLDLTSSETLYLDISLPISQEDSLLHTTGLHHSRAQVNITEAISITGDLTDSSRREIKVSKGAITGKIEAINTESSALITASDIQCRHANTTSCHFELETRVPRFIDHTKELTATNLYSSAKVQILSDRVDRNLKLENIKLSAGKIDTSTLEVSDITLEAPSAYCEIAGPLTCTIRTINSQLGTVTSEQASLSGTLNFIDSKVALNNELISFDSAFETSHLELETPEKYSVSAAAKGKLSLQNNQLVSHSQIVAGPVEIELNGHYDLLTSSGKLKFSIPDVTFNTGKTLSETLQGLPADIVSGTLSAGGSLSFPPQSGDNFYINLLDIAVIYKESFATGIVGKLEIENKDGHWITPVPSPLSIASINAGLPLEKIQLSLQLDKQKDITLQQFSADFLRGRVTSEALVWNLNQESRKSTLSAQGVSLEALTEVTHSENFAASGHIDLTIPLVTGAEGITVEAGHLRGEAPGGQLRYYGAFSPQMLASNPQLKLIANALEDYEFRTLEGRVDYPASGDLQLQLKLVGRSDAIDSDRDLVINLNLENNIPDMLRSLQASRDLTKTLEKQLDQ